MITTELKPKVFAMSDEEEEEESESPSKDDGLSGEPGTENDESGFGLDDDLIESPEEEF